MEGMTLGLIQSLTMPGNETMAFKLPGFKETLRHFLHAIEQGKPVSLQRVEEYLDWRGQLEGMERAAIRKRVTRRAKRARCRAASRSSSGAATTSSATWAAGPAGSGSSTRVR